MIFVWILWPSIPLKLWTLCGYGAMEINGVNAPFLFENQALLFTHTFLAATGSVLMWFWHMAAHQICTVLCSVFCTCDQTWIRVFYSIASWRLCVSSKHWLPVYAGWCLVSGKIQAHNPVERGLVAVDVRWYAVFHQTPSDMVDGAPFRGDAPVETILGEPEVPYCRYCDLTSIIWRWTSTISISHQIVVNELLVLFHVSRNRSADASSANFQEHQRRLTVTEFAGWPV